MAPGNITTNVNGPVYNEWFEFIAKNGLIITQGMNKWLVQKWMKQPVRKEYMLFITGYTVVYSQ